MGENAQIGSASVRIQRQFEVWRDINSEEPPREKQYRRLVWKDKKKMVRLEQANDSMYTGFYGICDPLDEKRPNTRHLVGLLPRIVEYESRELVSGCGTEPASCNDDLKRRPVYM